MEFVLILLNYFVVAFNYLVGIYLVCFNSFYSVLLVIALLVTLKFIKKIRYMPFREFRFAYEMPPVSIIIAVHNEENVILRAVKSALAINYSFFEIIIINDGSNDDTLKILVEHFNLRKINLIYRKFIKTESIKGFYFNPDIPHLIVIDKEHGGKSEALNCGINMSHYPYFCSVDADSVLDADALIRLMIPVIASPVSVIACTGIIRILTNRKETSRKEIDLPKKSILIFQVLEYLRAFQFARVGLDLFNCLVILPGAFSMFNKSAVLAVGGYSKDVITEDMDLIVKLHKYYKENNKPYKIRFIPDPICWTEAPDNIGALGNQRKRWHIGLVQTLFKYRSMLLNPQYGSLGLIILPYFLFFEALGPVVEFLGYLIVPTSYFLGIIQLELFMLFLFFAFGYGILLSTGSVFLEEITYKRYPKWTHVFKLLVYSVLENFGYRQINVWWRFESIILYMLGYTKWRYVRKKGQTEP